MNVTASRRRTVGLFLCDCAMKYMYCHRSCSNATATVAATTTTTTSTTTTNNNNNRPHLRQHIEWNRDRLNLASTVVCYKTV
jgi:hypothetical protein